MRKTLLAGLAALLLPAAANALVVIGFERVNAA